MLIMKLDATTLHGTDTNIIVDHGIMTHRGHIKRLLLYYKHRMVLPSEYHLEQSTLTLVLQSILHYPLVLKVLIHMLIVIQGMYRLVHSQL